MKDEHAQFSGSIPAAYDRYLGPMLFQPYAEDLAARLHVEENGSVWNWPAAPDEAIVAITRIIAKNHFRLNSQDRWK